MGSLPSHVLYASQFAVKHAHALGGFDRHDPYVRHAGGGCRIGIYVIYRRAGAHAAHEAGCRIHVQARTYNHEDVGAGSQTHSRVDFGHRFAEKHDMGSHGVAVASACVR